MFDEKIRELRKKHKITQQELADAVKIDRTTISKYESGGITPPMESAKKICDFFNVSLGYMFDADVSEKPAQAGLDERVLLLQRAADENNLTGEELRDILAYARYRYPDRFRGLTDNENA